MSSAREEGGERTERRKEKCRVNDITSLSFSHDNNKRSGDCDFPPLFTHQLFDDEEILLFSSEDAKIHIKVNKDLSSDLEISGMTAEEEALVRRKLEAVAPTHDDSDSLLSSSLCEPLGKKVKSVSLMDQEFDLYLATHESAAASALLLRAEKIAMFYIETAESVDFSDDRWEILWIYQAVSCRGSRKTTHTLAGYMTLFTFHNPFAGSKIRVCQVLIFPPYQGLGLGHKVLLELYSLIAGREDIMEITVEDPCEGFQRLRDAADVEWAHTHSCYVIRDEDVTNVSRQLKLVPAQVQFIQNCTSYRKLLHSSAKQAQAVVGQKRSLSAEENADPTLNSADKWKAFRLRIKKQLLKENGDLKGLKKREMQNELDILYKEYQARLEACCKKEHLRWAE